VPIVLVGTKADLRNVKSMVDELKKNNEEPITIAQGEHMAQEIGAMKYIECSAKTQLNLSSVFEEAVRCVINPQPVPGTVTTAKKTGDDGKTKKASKGEKRNGDKKDDCVVS
jgi:GTPase SAR1 family protein